ncbi:MAG TPA: AbrB/MazE/SpoVT family DNA-binding domain-containing protein [Candidatus Babeliales bacterium]|nr:AbrB/MazE/SpoVT family DNA-binding domain-containing protein [Candidatus Babeliales bacterium]
MVKKLTKHGNSLAILLDKPILEMLNINEKTPLKIRTDGINIIIEPIQELPSSDEKTIKELYEELATKYNTVLKKLSNN